LMQGVITLNGEARMGVPLAAGATQVAAYSDATSAVAFKTTAGHTAVGLPAYLGAGSNRGTGDYARIIVNAGRWLKPDICASTLIGQVTWQGRTAGTARNQHPITLTLKLGTTERNYPAQNTDVSGFFTSSVSTLPAATYNWRVKGPKYLASCGTVALPGTGAAQQSMGVMRAGDVNNDNLVSATDFSILRSTFAKACGDAGYDDRADFNGDCLVNSQDFTLLRNNFGSAGCPVLGPAQEPAAGSAPVESAPVQAAPPGKSLGPALSDPNRSDK
jgi:hypothetical protein